MEFSFSAWLKQGAIIGKVGKWVEVLWGEPSLHKQEENLKSPAIYHNSFFRESKNTWSVYPHSQRFNWKDWKQLIVAELKQHKFEESEMDWQEPNKAAFTKVFQNIKKEIKQKTIQKAVPVVVSQAPRQLSPELSILQALKMSPVNTYVFGSWGPEDGFLGFSPEILFLREKKNVIKTMALAGTRKKEQYQQDPEEFLRDPKEMKEHQFVIDDIIKRLEPLGKVKSSKTSFLELNFLTHLYTPLQVTLTESLSFEKLVAVLHPTPALGIVPREQEPLLKKWREEEKYLGAPFGIRWSETEYLCLVAIRQLQWNKSHYFISSGCGIVEESDLDEEWQELRMKRESVRRMFHL